MQPLKPVLVVEDSLEDFTALGRVFRRQALRNPLLHCESGEQALEYLQGCGKLGNGPAAMPAIIMLDLNLPGTDGRTVLDAVKRDPQLHRLPVIMLSSSANARDVEDCYRLGANSYLTKPIGFEALEQKIKLTINYWLGATELPYQS